MARKSKWQQLSESPLKTDCSYLAGEYLRLSVEKRHGEKSESIENQHKFISDYVSTKTEIKIVESYIDDETTGTNYDRAGFQKMMKDLRDGKINCIITKDLSRLGRNAEETDEYIMTIFPFMNIRYIAINDKYDSLYEKSRDFSLELSIKNLFNGQYAMKTSQDVSVTFDRMRREGKYIGPRPPYGYLIDPKNHHHLIIEEETYRIVQEIFQRIAKGESYYQIVRWLQENKVSPPFKHFYELGLFYKEKFKNTDRWYRSTIKTMVSNPTYYGALVISKHKKALWLGIPHHKIPKEEWEIVENTHEPIIDKSLFLAVQEEIKNREQKAAEKEKKSEKKKVENIFAQKVFCGCCKKKMIRTFYSVKGEKRKYYFRCSEYIYKEGRCKKGYIPELKLKNIVLKLLKQYIKMLEIKQQQYDEKKQSREKIIQLYNKKIDENTKQQKKLYVDFKTGVLNQEEYLFLKDKNKAEKEELLSQWNMLNEVNQSETQIKIPKRIQLSQEIIDSFIERIEIFSSEDIHIQFKFNHDFMMSGGEK